MRAAHQPPCSGRVRVCEVTVAYEGPPVLRGVTFTAEPGEVLGVLGPNGAGKSTLIKALLGLVAPAAGSVSVDGQPVTTWRRSIAYLPQRAAVDWDFPVLAREVVAMGREIAAPGRRARRHDRAIVHEALERVGAADLARRPVGELSGGQQQRVMFARAIAQDARVVLLDEPFTGVDAVTCAVLEQQLRLLADEGRTVIAVHHDVDVVNRSVDRVLLLAGRVVALGTPAEVVTGPLLSEAYGSVPAFALAIQEGTR